MNGRPSRVVGVLAGLLVAPLLAGCPAPSDPQRRAGEAPAARSPDPSPTTPSPSAPARVGDSHSATQQPSPSPPARPEREPKRSYLTIPALAVRDLPVVRYRGSPDDGPGTRIQNRGPAASPRGPDGGVGPGEIGNYIVTGHRLSGKAPFRYLPRLRPGHRVLVRSGDTVYVYETTGTRRTSFRSARSLAEQAAAVPGHPGKQPVEAMITLSTCATIEDHAAGNYWADRFGNPEHRIDKIGVLVATRPE